MPPLKTYIYQRITGHVRVRLIFLSCWHW